MIKYQPTQLPPKFDFDSPKILKRLPKSRAALAELKGISATIPNASIILNTLALQINRKTASRYLNILAKDNILMKLKIGNYNYYINNGLMNIITNYDYKL